MFFSITNFRIHLAVLLFSYICSLNAKPKAGDADFPSPTPSQRHDQKILEVKNGNYDLVLIGDSITQSIGELGGKYAVFKSIWNKYYGPLHSINLGYNGYRTEQILWNLENGELNFNKPPKVVMLLVGTNNGDDRNFKTTHTAEEIYRGTKAIVDIIKTNHPNTKILVLRIFPRGGDDEKGTSPPIFKSSRRCIEICKKAGLLTKKLADGEQVFWMDINGIFLLPTGKINTRHMWDLLHPSPAGAEAWAKAVRPTLLRLINDQPVPTVQKIDR
ncbi:MAG: GDSL-type esterase/lipase family protein [Verrucomicrobiota bacterium]|nr:GDSL-type esterase/lipase family protein [Verrucomicrobiota bacterium]